MTGITAQAQHASLDGRSGRLRRAHRYLAGAAAAGAAAGLVLTGTAAGSAAPIAGSSGPAASRVITLTSSASSAAGHLTVRFTYKPGKRGAITPVSLTFAGGSPVKLAHPALVFTLRPVSAPIGGKPVQVKSRPPVPVVVRIRDLGAFSGRLPVKQLPRIDWIIGKAPHRRLVVPSLMLATSLASVSPKRPKAITALVGMQVGILLSPIGIASRVHGSPS